MIRFNHNIEDSEETCTYFENRAMQLRYSGYEPNPNIVPYIVDGQEIGTVCKFSNNKHKREWHSLYILKQYRKKGFYKKWIEQDPDKWIITTPGCNIYDAVSSMTNKVYLEKCFSDNPGYQAIEKYYGNKSNKLEKRPSVFYMQHIDEGLIVLSKIFAGWQAKTAYCLHPLCQSDSDLYQHYSNRLLESVEKRTIILAMEYRNIANAFLSPMEDHPGYNDHTRIQLSPLQEVNQMLVADKVQNYKNFIENYKNIHPRSDWLERYFKQWFKALADNGCHEHVISCLNNEKLKIVRA